MTREQPQRSGTREAWLAGGLAVAALLVMAPGPRVSPDSLELLETVPPLHKAVLTLVDVEGLILCEFRRA